MPEHIPNPIDQRHANRTGIRCRRFWPLLWRRIGMAFAWFPALYMWAFFAASFVIIYPFGLYRSYLSERGLPVNAITQYFLAFESFLSHYLIAFSVLLGLPLGIVWLVLMLIWIRRGVVEVRAKNLAIGIAATVLPVVLFVPLLLLLDYLWK